MNIQVNGQAREVSGDALSVTQLLGELKVERPEMVSVELNGEFVERETFDETQVKDSDKVEFLYFMGGGA